MDTKKQKPSEKQDSSKKKTTAKKQEPVKKQKSSNAKKSSDQQKSTQKKTSSKKKETAEKQDTGKKKETVEKQKTEKKKESSKTNQSKKQDVIKKPKTKETVKTPEKQEPVNRQESKTASKKQKSYFVLACIIFMGLVLLITLAHHRSSKGEPLIVMIKENEVFDLDAYIKESQKKKKLTLKVDVPDEGVTIFYTSEHGGYRYGPSIVRNEDGSLDAWFASPGNNSTEWDYITYRHSEDGVNWSQEKTVLKPTKGSKDRCSVCDPGVTYFNGYYYLAYTATADAGRKGYNNSAFVCRSKDPDGPFEKWDGTGWSDDPEPLIAYEGDPNGWGIGEVSFVIRDKELLVYYTYFDIYGGYEALARADLVDDWPATLRFEGSVCPREHQDSLDVVYVEDLEVFLAFSIEYRMTESSRIIVYLSEDGTDFKKAETAKTNVMNYAHNLGISKGLDGHITSKDTLLAGYGYGRGWGRWSLKIQELAIRYDYK
ncbi:MAG: family 43 glycosylhydrolase [Erysipelotrichaceae bacterium]|nr:family 43 glycosylhydrolase [Erysipelotrichaceae bacterium]